MARRHLYFHVLTHRDMFDRLSTVVLGAQCTECCCTCHYSARVLAFESKIAGRRPRLKTGGDGVSLSLSSDVLWRPSELVRLFEDRADRRRTVCQRGESCHSRVQSHKLLRQC